MKCQTIYKYQVGQFIYKYTEKILPPLFTHIFIQQSSLHSHNTRFSNNFVLCRFLTDLKKRSFRYHGELFWNNLDPNIKKCATLNSFKFNLKKYLIIDNL